MDTDCSKNKYPAYVMIFQSHFFHDMGYSVKADIFEHEWTVGCTVFQAVCESQSQAEEWKCPQPSAVVQAGTGPPRAWGGAG